MNTSDNQPFPVADDRRHPPYRSARSLILTLCFMWSVFQLYVASVVPFVLTEWTGLSLVFNNQEVRQIHLAFAFALAMLAYPLNKQSPGAQTPWYDYAAAMIAATSCLYLLVFKDQISDRAGLPTDSDLWISAIGMLSLALALYRCLGLPLLIVCSCFLFYVFFGDQSFMPDTMQWKGASLNKALWHFWMQTEGVFGVALGVASSMIFFVCTFRSPARESRRRDLFYPPGLRPVGTSARWTSESRSRCLRVIRHLLGLVNRQCRVDRNLHYSFDEKDRPDC